MAILLYLRGGKPTLLWRYYINFDHCHVCYPCNRVAFYTPRYIRFAEVESVKKFSYKNNWSFNTTIPLYLPYRIGLFTF